MLRLELLDPGISEPSVRRHHIIFSATEDLKLGNFAPADKGQMELYLAWLKENELAEGEGTPLGLILCAGKNDETVRLLRLDQGEIRVAAYVADVLPQKKLEQKLHDAVTLARARLAAAESSRASAGRR